MHKLVLILLLCVTSVFSHGYFTYVAFDGTECEKSQTYYVQLRATGQCMYNSDDAAYELYDCEGTGFYNNTWGCDANCESCTGTDSGNELDYCAADGPESFLYSCPEEVVLPPFDYLADTTYEQNDCSGEVVAVNYYPVECQVEGSAYGYISCKDDQVTQMICDDSECTQNCAAVYAVDANSCNTGQMFTCGKGSAGLFIPSFVFVCLAVLFAL